MKSTILLPFILGLGLTPCAAQAPSTAPAAAAAPAEPAPETGHVALGHEAYRVFHCARCHMLGDVGRESGKGPNLTMVGYRKSAEWIDRWLADPAAWYPPTEMPNFNLTLDQRADLVAYLLAQKGQAWGPVKPWRTPDALKAAPAARGEIIFNMAGCAGCHGRNGAGGYPNNNVAGGLIPALTKVAEGYTKAELVAKISNGAVPAPADASKPKPLIEMPRWSQALTPEDISDVADYLLSLAPKGAKSDDGF